ncbi:uncharacterized protein LOC111634415 [Centruroides sculpturatus]|uniref:uncharacterized protein LOC111634415 n=1 Tax=Centruroides sculpturatus TaxID=218467 RepID=UPI000C6D0992|nr:uncharacterized protein LOC111634415 [Centruroides sculpturatus]
MALNFKLSVKERSHLIRYEDVFYKFKIILKEDSISLLSLDQKIIKNEIEDVIRNILWLDSELNVGDLPKSAIILTNCLSVHIQKMFWAFSKLISFRKGNKKYRLHPYEYVLTIQCKKLWISQKKCAQENKLAVNNCEENNYSINKIKRSIGLRTIKRSRQKLNIEINNSVIQKCEECGEYRQLMVPSNESRDDIPHLEYSEKINNNKSNNNDGILKSFLNFLLTPVRMFHKLQF